MRLSNNQLQVVHEYLEDDAPILYFLLDPDGLILTVNTFARQVLGRAVAGIVFDELLVDFRKLFNLKEYASTDKHHLLNISILDANPKSFFFSFRKFDDSILVFGREDAEELDLLRSELFSTNQELNNLTRTLHKKNAQLAHLNSLKNQFLGMAAHDLRKPISVILSYSEFLFDEAQEQLDEEQVSFVKRIEGSALSMKRMVDDFLDVSVIEAGGFQLNVKRINPADILGKSLVLARIQAQKKGVELEVEIDPELPEIPLDGDKIEQAMSNLLGNAIEHSVPGKCVSVTLKEIDRHVNFSVRDRGTGMSAEVMKNLFTPFSGSGSVKTGGEKSTGLGLTITRKIIDAHKGEIIAESEEGTGTTFTICFADIEE
jgi:signal transduction histidine kinase